MPERINWYPGHMATLPPAFAGAIARGGRGGGIVRRPRRPWPPATRICESADPGQGPAAGAEQGRSGRRQRDRRMAEILPRPGTWITVRFNSNGARRARRCWSRIEEAVRPAMEKRRPPGRAQNRPADGHRHSQRGEIHLYQPHQRFAHRQGRRSARRNPFQSVGEDFSLSGTAGHPRHAAA